MIDFPHMQNLEEPLQQKMSLVEYIRFCDFCLKNNSRITPENCMDRKAEAEVVQQPFRL